MSADLQALLRRIAELSVQDLQELRQHIDAMAVETPERALARKLRERGLVRSPRMAQDAGGSTDFAPATVTGEPISQALIRERR